MTANAELVFAPLGGCGEVGMNLNLYGFGPEDDRQWIIVDCGVTFGDLATPGVDVILPDPSFIVERRENLLGIVLTHAHEDHMGAVAHLWPQLKAPIYATPFTAWLMRDRLQEAGLLGEAKVREVSLGARFSLGPFDLQLISLTHSIPEPNGIAIRTPAGLVLHTGDWKLDPDPLVGAPTDDGVLKALGEEGVLAMICDSTNVFVEGEAGSEASVRDEMIKVVGECRGRVAVAAFASNVARLQTAVHAADAHGRHVALVGRSMERMVKAASSVGMFSGVSFVSADEAGFLPEDKILLLCTGSQGEPRAALSRIAEGSHRSVTLSEGDTVVFSSREIPGNEVAIGNLQNKLVDRGVHVITERQRPIHVSGHPCRDELRAMYQWVRPHIAIPVHGERRHVVEHAAFAKSLQVPHAYAPHDGDVIALSSTEGAVVIDEAPAGRLHLDGDFLVPADDDALRTRRKVSFNGAITVALAVNGVGKVVGGPDVRAQGLPEDEDDTLAAFASDAAEEAEEVWASLPRETREDDKAAEHAIARAVGKMAREVYNKRPLVDAIVLRV